MGRGIGGRRKGNRAGKKREWVRKGRAKTIRIRVKIWNR